MIDTKIEKRRVVLIAAVCLFALAVVQDAAFGQIRTVRGLVTDEAGTPIVGVAVEIQRTDVRRKYKTKTNKKGEYIYTGLSFGIYRIIIRKEGYNSDFVQGLRPKMGEENRYDFVMKKGTQTKLAFEYSKADLEKMRQQHADQQKLKKSTAEVKAFFAQAIELVNQKQYPEAIEAFKKALEKDPEQPNIWASLADAQSKAGQTENAVKSIQEAITRSPDVAGFHQNLGVLYGKLGRTADATAEFEKAAGLNPQAAAVNYFNLGATLVNTGKTVDAITAFKKAVEADPNYAEAYYEMGICYIGLNKPKESVEVLQKYIQIGENLEHVSTAKALVEQLSKGQGGNDR